MDLRACFVAMTVAVLLALPRTAHAQAKERAPTRDNASPRTTGGAGVMAGGAGPAGWQVPAEIIRATPATIGDGFGSACAMNEDGTVLVVGASDTTVNGAAAVGAVHIYVRDIAGRWVHAQKIECPAFFSPNLASVTAPSLSLFGWSVAISGETIVVGAPVATAPGGLAFEGRAYVFQRSPNDPDGDGLWGREVTAGEEGEQLTFRAANKVLKPSDPEMIGYFGGAVAITKQDDAVTSIAVGSPFRGTANQGGAYLFEGTGDVFTQKRFLIPEDVIGQDQFGTKLAMDGVLLVVGVQASDSDDLINAGSAHIFRRGLDGVWPATPEAVLLPENATRDDGFGSSVSVVGSTIAVGAPGTDRAGAGGETSLNNGSAYVYRHNGIGWAQEAEVFAREANGGNAFGFSVALADSGSLLLVGSPGYETLLVNAGAGFAFRRGDSSTWIQEPWDLWTPSAGTNQAVGEQSAISRNGLVAVMGSRNNATPSLTVNRMFSWTYNPDPMSAPVPEGTPATPDAPGIDGPAPGTTTTQTPPGGITPTTGGFGGAGFSTPATPAIEEWGIVRASVIAVDRANHRLMIIFTDGMGQLETNNESKHVLASFDPTWQVLGLGDVNGDGSSDILFHVPATRKVKAMIRLGKTIQEIVTVGTTTVGDRFIGISDWGVGTTDGPAFLRADGTSAVFWVVQGGAVSSQIEWTLGAGDWSFRMAQMSETRGPDILARDDATGDIVHVIPSATGATIKPLTPPKAGYRFASAQDLDGDGTTDLLWEDSNGILHLQFFNADGTVRFLTAWDTGLGGWRVDPAGNFAQSGRGILFTKNEGAVLVLTIHFEPYNTLPAGRGAIRVDYARVVGEFDDGYEVLGPADEP